MQRNSNQSL